MKRERNAVVDLQKFYYSCMIVLFHIYVDTKRHFPGAGTAVEFFVLVAGVFFFRSWDRKKCELNEEERLEYPLMHLKKRILRFLPYTTIGFAVSFFVKRIFLLSLEGKAVTVTALVDNFVKNFWELFLLSMNGMNRNAGMLNGPLWTLSAMVIVEFVLLTIFVVNEKKFLKLVLPVTLLLGYGWYASLEDIDHVLFHGVTTMGVIRVYLLYAIAYYIARGGAKLAEASVSQRGQMVLMAVEVLLHVIFLWIACTKDNRYYRWFSTLLFALALCITVSGRSSLANLFKQNRVTNFLGKWSMGIYIMHMPVLYAFRGLYTDFDDYYRQKYVICFFVCVASLLTIYLGKHLERVGIRLNSSLKSLILQPAEQTNQ